MSSRVVIVAEWIGGVKAREVTRHRRIEAAATRYLLDDVYLHLNLIAAGQH